MRIAVLADDLSGAMNIGVEFASAGLATQVSYGGAAAEAEVWILNSETRSHDAATASQLSPSAAAQLVAWGPDLYVKKIDSLLRGHIGPEIDALMAASGQTRCLLIAAAPRLNRITVGGYCLVDGELLDQARQRVDPSSQVQGASVPEIIRRQTSQAVTHLDMATICQGEAALQAAMRAQQGILTADCSSQEDLNLDGQGGLSGGNPALRRDLRPGRGGHGAAT